jgi:hypothetical protein
MQPCRLQHDYSPHRAVVDEKEERMRALVAAVGGGCPDGLGAAGWAIEFV